MRIAVIGAGWIGVSTAHALVSQGHEVTLLERRAAVAEEASFAPGAPWGLDPFASWSTPASGRAQLPRWWPAGRAARAQKRAAAHRAHLALRAYSQGRLDELLRRTPLPHERASGHLVLFSTEAELQRSAGTRSAMDALGVTHRLLTPVEARALEPAIDPAAPLAAALALPQDSAANARLLAQQLRQLAQGQGLRVLIDCEVEGLGPTPGSTSTWSVQLRRNEREGEGITEFLPPGPFDAVVLCAGDQTVRLARMGGATLALRQRGTLSITVPLRQIDAEARPPPQGVLTDAARRVVMSRLGQRIRIAGVLDRLPDRRAPGVPPDEEGRRLFAALDTWLPGAGRVREAQSWSGSVVESADGLPLIGPVPGPVRGLWVHTGHGHAGLALACGGARLLADLIDGRAPDLDPGPYLPARST